MSCFRTHTSTFRPGSRLTPAAEVEEVQCLLEQEWEDDVARGTNPPSRDSSQWLTDYARWLMRQDRKSPGLKLLQGLIWEGGYADGSLRGSVYPDVPPALTRWRDDGLVISIYSSGSVLAQRLLFSTTTYGDLTRFHRAVLRHCAWDRSGKRRVIRALPQQWRCLAAELLFVSDVIAELEAARLARMQVVECVRDGELRT